MTTVENETSVPPAEGVTPFDPKTVYSPFAPGGKIRGSCKPGWEGVREAFAANFSNGRELGAQLCISQGGEIVVDLCGVAAEGGTTETQAPPSSYSFDTLQAIFSSGKNLEVVVIAKLVDMGLVDYDDPISKHWPAFGQNGKEETTIADLMRHSAGMAWFLDPEDTTKFRKLTSEQIESRDPMHEIMETSPPQKLGDSKRTYHSFTRGLVVDGIVKHVDPARRTIGQFARDEILVPLGIDDAYVVSLTDEGASKLSVATMRQFPQMFTICHEVGPAVLGAGDPVIARLVEALTPTSEMMRAGMGVDLVKLGQADPDTGAVSADFINAQPARKLEATSAWSFASARGMTSLLSVFANGGNQTREGTTPLITQATMSRVFDKSVSEVDESLKAVIGISQGGLGEMWNIRDSEGVYDGKEFYKGFYGWGGWGGSINVVNPERGVTLSYAMTAMGNHLVGDTRTDRIMKEVSKVLELNPPEEKSSQAMP